MGGLFSVIMQMIGGAGGAAGGAAKGGASAGFGGAAKGGGLGGMLDLFSKGKQATGGPTPGGEGSFQDMVGGANQSNPMFTQMMQGAMQQQPQQQHQQIQPAQMQMPVAQQHTAAQTGVQAVPNSNIDLSALLKLLSGG